MFANIAEQKSFSPKIKVLPHILLNIPPTKFGFFLDSVRYHPENKKTRTPKRAEFLFEFLPQACEL